MNYETCFQTVVGSHMWGMDTPESDKDLFRCYIAPSEDFLLGKRHDGGHQSHSEGIDVASFEIGHVIRQLKKGNLNFIQGVMSGIMEETSGEHEELKKIVRENIAKNVYNSVHGMSYKNYKKYFDKQSLSREDEAKKLKQIGRVIMFGVRILQGDGITFEPYNIESRYAVMDLIRILDKAYDRSKLPEKPDDKPFDDFLLKVRLSRLPVIQRLCSIVGRY